MWRAFLVFLLALLVAGIWWFVELEPSAARAPLPEPTSESALAVRRASSLEAADANVRTQTDTQTATSEAAPTPKDVQPASATLRARCVDENARPIAGVELLRYGTDLVARSDSDGLVECALSLVRSGPSTVQFVLHDRRHLGQSFKRVLSAGQLCDLGDVRMPLGGRILGRVLDTVGKPCAKASVVTTHIPFAKWPAEQEQDSITATTSEDGSFALDGVPAGTLRVAAYAEGYVPVAVEPLEVLAGQELRGIELAFRAKEEVDESGLLVRVLQPSGEPLARAYVSSEWHDGDRSSISLGSTDAQGTRRIRCGPGGGVDIVVSPLEPRFPNAFALDVPISRRTLDIQLTEGTTQTLLVVDEHRAPIESYALRVLCEPQYHPARGGAMSRDVNGLLRDLLIGHGIMGPYAPRPQERKPHAGGRTELHVGGTAFVVQVDAAGYAQGEAGPFPALSAPDEIQIVLKRLPGIHGHIQSAGEPVAGAWVKLFKATEEHHVVHVIGFPSRFEPVVRAETKSAMDGSFELPLGDAGNYVIQAGSAELGEAESETLALLPRTGAHGIVLELPALGVIEGRLLVAANEDARDRVVGASRGNGAPCSVRTDAQGRFRFAKLTPGAWLLLPLAEDIDPAGIGYEVRLGTSAPTESPSTCVVRPGETTRIEIDLRQKADFVAQVELPGWEGGKWSASLEPLGASFSRKASVKQVSLDELRMSVDQPGDYALQIEVAKPEQHGYLTIEERVHLDVGTNKWTLAGPGGRLTLANTLAEKVHRTLVCELPGGRHATFELNFTAHEEATILGLPLGRWTRARYDNGQRIDEESVEVTAGTLTRMEWK